MTLNHCFNMSSFILALVTSLGLVTHANAQESRSFLIDLNSGTATDLGSVTATAINDAGQVVGNTSNGTFITGSNGVGMRDLGTLGGDMSRAYGINAAGQVVGYSSMANGQDHAFITGPDGEGMRKLGDLGGITAELLASTMPGGWSDGQTRSTARSTHSSPAQMARA